MFQFGMKCATNEDFLMTILTDGKIWRLIFRVLNMISVLDSMVCY